MSDVRKHGASAILLQPITTDLELLKTVEVEALISFGVGRGAWTWEEARSVIRSADRDFMLHRLRPDPPGDPQTMAALDVAGNPVWMEGNCHDQR